MVPCFTIICITEKLEVKILAYTNFISDFPTSYHAEKLVLHHLIFLLIKIRWIYEINNIKNERSGRCLFGVWSPPQGYAN